MTSSIDKSEQDAIIVVPIWPVDKTATAGCVPPEWFPKAAFAWLEQFSRP